MKRHTFYIITALALSALLTGCDSDDQAGGGQERVPVTIALDPGSMGLTTKASSVDVSEGIDEDAINTVDVWISGGTDNIHLTEANFNANWTAEVEMSTGTKQIYAVANMGDTYRSANVPNNGAVDALAQISKENVIPMSTTNDTTWIVTKSQLRYEVRLNRMVAKMNVTVSDERSSKTNEITNVMIGDLLAPQTYLFREGYGNVNVPYGTLEEWTWVDDNTYFYLHENDGTFPVTVTFSGGEAAREGSFTKRIPRNFIFPLVIHITDYSLQVNLEYSLAPIGVLPVTINKNNYTVTLPEGCTFKVTVTPKKHINDGAWKQGATWTWSEPNNDNESIVLAEDQTWPTGATIENGTSATITGSVSAQHVEGDCTFRITLQDDGEEPIPFTLTLKTRKLQDDEMTKTRSAAAEEMNQEVHIVL